jgi:hypothetical protein
LTPPSIFADDDRLTNAEAARHPTVRFDQILSSVALHV